MRIVLYFIFIGSLFFMPLLPEKKSVKVSAVQSDKSIDITLYKPLPKEVKKEVNPIVKKKPQKVIKKKIVKKKVVKKKVIKKRIKKEVKRIEIPKEVVVTVVKEVKEEKIAPKIVKELVKPLLQQNLEVEQEIKKRAKVKAQKDSYYSVIFAQIESKKRYPKKALRFRQEGSVRVSFTILKDGTLKAFKIVKKSEHNIFNKAVKKIFKKLKKFPAPPPEIGFPVEITITIQYDIKN